MIYDGLHVVDCTAGIAGAYCSKLLADLGADVVFGAPIDGDALFTYLRTSQRRAADLEPWLAVADVVVVGDAQPAPAPRPGPLVTVSITALGHGGRTLAIHWRSGRGFLTMDTRSWRLSTPHGGFAWSILAAALGGALALLLLAAALRHALRAEGPLEARPA